MQGILSCRCASDCNLFGNPGRNKKAELSFVRDGLVIIGYANFVSHEPSDSYTQIKDTYPNKERHKQRY